MHVVNKVAAVGIVLFCTVLAGFIGARVDQTTIALLGGTFIGLVVAIPATALVVWLGIRQRQQTEWPEPKRPAPPPHMPPAPPQITHNHTHTHYNIVLHVAPDAEHSDVIDAIVEALPPGATAFDARLALQRGDVRIVPMLPPAGEGR